ncbi:hypothetical protein FDY95_24715 [Hymenobacter jeollabukensis]|uniref:Uncharacterized protein n=1 Tax=Hymenobacter jeollabukensis TaxID=2025313 RepID=A0A5R8WIC4_9BACT|nr:hypothetical protein FDY95_24715 [Hymenobacter jeollabukensis]
MKRHLTVSASSPLFVQVKLYSAASPAAETAAAPAAPPAARRPAPAARPTPAARPGKIACANDDEPRTCQARYTRRKGRRVYLAW